MVSLATVSSLGWLVGCGADPGLGDGGDASAPMDAATSDADVDAGPPPDAAPIDRYRDCSDCPMNCLSVGGSGFLCATGCSRAGRCAEGLSGTAEPYCLDDESNPIDPNGICLLQCTTPGEQAECPDGMLCFIANLPGMAGQVCGWPVPAACVAVGPAICDLHPPCGCPESAACDLTQFGAEFGETECRPAGDIRALGGCVPFGDARCGSGETCVGQPTGLCRAYCSEDADCGAGGTCRPIRTGAPPAPPIPGAAVCTTPCNPFAPSDATAPFVACPSGVGCRTRSRVAAGAVTDCTVADASLTEGDACTAFCAVGLMCLPDAADSSRCQRPCIVGAVPSDCPTGTCETLDLTLGVGEVGYCRLPAL